MKKLLYTAVALALSATASAQAAPLVACDHCEYMRPTRYVGTYSELTGYRGTFQNLDIVADLEREIGPGMGNDRQFDNYYVFDLVVDSEVTLVIRTQRATALAGPWGVQLFLDPGTSCNFETCTFVEPDFDNALFTEPNLFFGGVRATRTLAAGRYMIRIAAGTRSTGEAGYTARLTTRPLQ